MIHHPLNTTLLDSRINELISNDDSYKIVLTSNGAVQIADFDAWEVVRVSSKPSILEIFT